MIGPPLSTVEAHGAPVIPNGKTSLRRPGTTAMRHVWSRTWGDRTLARPRREPKEGDMSITAPGTSAHTLSSLEFPCLSTHFTTTPLVELDAPLSRLGVDEPTPSTPTRTARPRVSAGRAGTAPPTAPSRAPTGSSPTSARSRPTSVSSRPARRPTSTSSAAGSPGAAGRDVLMAGKRYRSSKHRLFHRDAGYLEGRRVRKSREMRAMRTRTSFGKQLISGLWAFAEFETLGTLWAEGLPVPYPVQMSDDEMLMEFIGDPDGRGRPASGPDATRAGPAAGALRAAARRDAPARRARLGARRPLALQRPARRARATPLGSSSSTGRRSSTSSATRTDRSSSSATPATCATGSPGAGTRSTTGLLFGDLMAAATSRW